MVNADNFVIEVVYIDADETIIKPIIITENSTIKDAIRLSGIMDTCPNISLEKNKVGIFSQIMTLDTRLKEGDRVEIYRPLKVDPKESRRRRAKIKSK